MINYENRQLKQVNIAKPDFTEDQQGRMLTAVGYFEFDGLVSGESGPDVAVTVSISISPEMTIRDCERSFLETAQSLAGQLASFPVEYLEKVLSEARKAAQTGE